jgi:hypothetical protein
MKDLTAGAKPRMRGHDTHYVRSSGRPAPSPADPHDGATLRREGDYWIMTYDGVVLRLRDGKGLRYLAHLLERPGTAIAATELAMESDQPSSAPSQALEPPSPRAPKPDPEHARVAVTKRIKEIIKRIAVDDPTLGYHLKAAVKTGYLCTYEPEPGRLPWRVTL